MNKNIKRNFDYLTRLGKNAKGEETKGKVNKLIALYGERKIAQLSTAEQMILGLLKANTPNLQKSVNKKYAKIVEKNEDNEPLAKRVADSKYVQNVDVADSAKSKADIKITLRKGVVNLQEAFGKVYKKLHGDVVKMLEKKGSMKIQTAVHYSVAKRDLTTGKNVIEQKYALSRAVEVTKNNIKEILENQKESVEADIMSESDSWKLTSIDSYAVSTYSIKKVRGSSYIPTPKPFTGGKCGLINIQSEDEK
jgi:hypothetical protein